MTTVTLSPKFQLVIPKEVRNKMKLISGIRLEIISYGDRIELIPLRPIKELRGILSGMDSAIVREKDRIL